MELNEIGRRAKAASRHLGILSTSKKNEALRAVAAALVANSASIIAANEIDVKNAKENHMSEALLDRLSVNEARVKAMADGILHLCLQMCIVWMSKPARCFGKQKQEKAMQVGRLSWTRGMCI